MSLRGFLKELRRRHVLQVAVAYTGIGIVLLEVLTHLFHNFEAPHWVLKVITTLLIVGLPVTCLMAWGFEFREGRVRSIPRERTEAPPALPSPEAATPHPSIAVLPFTDMSAAHDQQYLGDGIAEELLNALASVDGLDVAARTSSFSLASKGAGIKEIGDTLHVRHVLEGSVRRAGAKLRVTAQLIDVESGFHLYSQSYDRAAEDIFSIQDEIAREIVRALLPRIGLDAAASLVKQGTGSLEAYNLRLMARQWLTRPSPAAFRSATEQLKEATRLDPRFAEAWGDLAYINGFVASWVTDPLPYLMEAHHSAETALALAPDNVESLLFRAYASLLVHHDAKASDDYYRRAREAGADPSVWAFNRAVLLDHPMGHFESATAYLEEAERKDPLAHNLKWMLAWNYFNLGRHDDAIRVAERLRQLEVSAPDGIAVCGILLGPAAARQARETLATLADTVPEIAHVAHLYQFTIDDVLGDRDHGRKLLDGLLAQAKAQLPVSPIVLAEGYKALGAFDDAIDWWSRAVDQHVPYSLAWMPTLNRSHPIIGKHPRFLALLRRMGLLPDAAAGASTP
jgi:TolB-like protein